MFGVLALVAAGLSLLLPETKGIQLPDTVEEVEGMKQVELELNDVVAPKLNSEQNLVTNQ